MYETPRVALAAKKKFDTQTGRPVEASGEIGGKKAPQEAPAGAKGLTRAESDQINEQIRQHVEEMRAFAAEVAAGPIKEAQALYEDDPDYQAADEASSVLAEFQGLFNRLSGKTPMEQWAAVSAEIGKMEARAKLKGEAVAKRLETPLQRLRARLTFLKSQK